ncbi:IS66 family transposase [Actimicrobium sp. CCC2.4]|uniref:IS66 family transposase n=1 Tax=Actimicrobium sp. CCC2.4 TaxID=3048606 RepID=UPI002AC8B087|nr:IS66 family transposase [Actimicrobium sp. CCC2.4]MEB0134598.1 IS66 family transposase [Actimicrobium sp. CCC2.4]WPX34039.1 IS66 family transposase [Actimicrobium sp. CCC2.4]
MPNLPIPKPLPDDIDALKAMVRAQQAAMDQMALVMASHAVEVEQLKLLIAKLQRMQFGRKSEKIDRQIAKLECRLEDLLAEEGVVDSLPLPPVVTPATGPATEPKGPVRHALPPELPREERILEPAETACPDCGGHLKPLGEDVSEQLEILNTAFKVIRHIRRKKACACCDRIVQVPAASRPILRGVAGPGLLAHILVAKFADHQPLYRQSVIYARQGVEIDRSSMGRWVGACSALMAPLVDALRNHVMAGTKLHADDTTVPVLAAGHGQTKTGRLWTYVRDDRSAASTVAPAVWFAYTPDRKGIHPQTHLAGFHGILQADAYAGFDAIYDTGRVQEAACWAHTRRKFHDLHVVHPTTFTTEVLRRIGELYKIEEPLRGKPPDVHRQVRQAQTLPLLVDFEAWLRARLPTLSAKSDTTKAINYALNQWQALLLYCDHGIAEIDNNAAERALRGVALGRKNFLFVGADSGGERAAAMYALIGTAKLNGIDPEAYLRHVLTHIADYPINQINDFLPWNVTEQLGTASR